MDKTNNTALDDPEPERYYDWMLWKMRQEKAKEPVVMTTEEMMKKEIADMQSSIHHLQIRVKELVEENEKLKSQIGDWKNSFIISTIDRGFIHNA